MFWVVLSVIALAIGVFAVAYYQTYVAPFRRPVVTVDDTVFRMRYFLDRAKLSGSGGMGTLTMLTNEQMIKYGAERYGITVTPQDVEDELRKRAVGTDNVTISDAEFTEWYRQQLNDSGVSDARYKDVITNYVLSARLQDYLSSQIPPALEHAHVYGIFVATYDEALAAKTRIEAGEDFSAVASEISLDGSRDNGGELDWIPKGVFFQNYDPASLETGKISDPLAIVEDPNTPPALYYILKVTEREDREVRPEFLAEVRSRAFQDWISEEQAQHTVKWGGWDGTNNNNYGSETDAWVNWQLKKMNS
jgi:hypothetical protein